MGNRKKPNKPSLTMKKWPDRLQVAKEALAKVDLPPDEKVVIKEVPAKVDGIVVGIAQIYDDGSVGVLVDENAPKDKLDKIRATAGEVGYSLVEDFPEGI
jgi:hypothetical protein